MGPPDNWSMPFAAMAEECSLKLSAAAAFGEVPAYFENLGALGLAGTDGPALTVEESRELRHFVMGPTL